MVEEAVYELEHGFPKLVEITPFKVIQGHRFCTNWRLIYDFLLMIDTNLPPILHRFQVMVKFSLARGEYLALTFSLGLIPYQYRRKW